MRGFPPTQIVLLILAFAGLAIPLARLTGSFTNSAAAEARAETTGADGRKTVQGGADHPEEEHVHEAVQAIVRVRFAHRPLTLSLQQEGRELLPKPDLARSPIEIDAKIEVSHEGNEFIVAATWAGNTPDTALTVEIEPEGFDGRSETRWSSEARLEEVITFQW